MTEIRQTSLPGVVEIIPKRFGDERGFFSETYNAKAYAGLGVTVDFVQDNHSYSRNAGVLRGLHYQLDPFAQDKLVRVTRGSVFDVAVDIRKGSPHYGEWVGVVLSAEKWNQLLIPRGFAHGFVTLEPETEFLYKVSALYSKEHDRAIRFDDPDIAIDWPVEAAAVTVSDKDRDAPFLKDAGDTFLFTPEV